MTATTTPMTDYLLIAQADAHRRATLEYARDVGTTTLFDVAGHLRGREREEPTDGGTDTLVVDLHHRHLPKLDAAGLVDYDPRTHTVVPRLEGEGRVVDLLAGFAEEGA